MHDQGINTFCLYHNKGRTTSYHDRNYNRITTRNDDYSRANAYINRFCSKG